MTNPKRAFISFDFDNNENLKNLLAGQAKLPDSPFSFHNWSVKEPYPQNIWIERVRNRIRNCDFVMVIIGPSTYLCEGVLIEINIAIQERKPLFGIYKEGNQYYIPRGLKNWCKWDWEEIKYMIQNLEKWT